VDTGALMPLPVIEEPVVAFPRPYPPPAPLSPSVSDEKLSAPAGTAENITMEKQSTRLITLLISLFFPVCIIYYLFVI
jgi:hypothetical protein